MAGSSVGLDVAGGSVGLDVAGGSVGLDVVASTGGLGMSPMPTGGSNVLYSSFLFSTKESFVV